MRFQQPGKSLHRSEAESKEKHGVWDPMPELTITITSHKVHPRVDSNTFIYHGQPYARVYLNPMPESTLTLCQSQLYIPQSGTLDLVQQAELPTLSVLAVHWAGGAFPCCGSSGPPTMRSFTGHPATTRFVAGLLVQEQSS
jgi:hypothetical protein